LEQGRSRESIIKEYGDRWNASDRTIDRYIAFAKDIVANKMELRDALVEAMRADVIVAEAEKWLKSNLELEARLCSIIEGTLETEKVVEDEKGKRVVRMKPTHADVIRAIDKLCKIRGMYDPKIRKANQPVIVEYKLQSMDDIKYIEEV